MRKLRYIILAATTIAIGTTWTSAGSPKFSVSRYDDSASNLTSGNVVYSLPATNLNLKVTYTVIAEIKRYKGYEYGSIAKSIEILKPIEVAVISAPDKKNRYLVHTEAMNKSPLFSTLAGITLTDDGRIKGANGTVDDRTLPTVSKFLTLIARVALMAPAGIAEDAKGNEALRTAVEAKLNFPDDEFERYFDEFLKILSGVDASLEAFTAEAKKSNPAKLKELEDRLDLSNKALQAFITRYRRYSTTDYTLNLPVCTEHFKGDAGEPLVAEIVPNSAHYTAALRKAVDQVVAGGKTLPKVNITLHGVTGEDLAYSSNYFDINDKRGSVNGVIHRYCEPVSMAISLPGEQEVIVDNRMVQFPQFSPFVVTEIKKKRFSKRATSLAISPNTANLVSYEVTRNSTAEAVVSTLDSTAKELQGIYVGAIGQRIAEQNLAAMTASPRAIDVLSTELTRYNTLSDSWAKFVSSFSALQSLPSPAN